MLRLVICTLCTTVVLVCCGCGGSQKGFELSATKTAVAASNPVQD